MSESTFFRVANASNQCSFIRGLVTWFPDHYTVEMVDESTAYEGKLETDDMSTYCETFGVSVKEYMEECKTAFKTNSETDQYKFYIEEEKLIIRKRTSLSSNLRVKLSSVSLETLAKADYSIAAMKLLDGALKCNGSDRQRIDTFLDEKVALLADNKKMATLLEEMEREKRKFEDIIYHKFVKLLNSKKEFHKKKKTVAVDEEPNEPVHVPRAGIVSEEAIFDADTDSDEVSDMISPRKDQAGSSAVCTVPSKKAKGNTNSPYSSPPKSSTVESVLSSFAFMDPSVSFSNK